MNNTRVIPARLSFKKDTGAAIEIFLLSPIESVTKAMIAKGSSTWHCTIGNVRRWKTGSILKHDLLQAELIDRDRSIVRFTWRGDHTFAEIIEQVGQTPLPPYLKRDADTSDKARYQTVYAAHEGAVAAPTAGLHLTDELLRQLKQKDILPAYVTLHVGAGTFMPVKAQNALDHTMHEEQVVVTHEFIEQLLGGRKIVAVGTTSLRVLESLYWYGCILEKNPTASFIITQTDPYHLEAIDIRKSLQNLLALPSPIAGRTSIYIHPGYEFHLCDALVTNFHQPGSTLMLLVAAFVGPGWKNMYQQALENGYRFLSYGDSSLLFK